MHDWLKEHCEGFPLVSQPAPGGQQCLEEIKKIDRLASIPVISYTTSKDDKESARLKEMGAAHIMSKPILPEDVYYMVCYE
jgi:CheY-like chemotaxis protein